MSKSQTIYFADALFDDQFARTLAASYAESADLGEAYAAARAISPHPTPDTWYDGWIELARAVESSAVEAERAGHAVTARNAYLRASEYYRQAFFFLRHLLQDERLQEAYAAHARTFATAAPDLGVALAESVESLTRTPPCTAGSSRHTTRSLAGRRSSRRTGTTRRPRRACRMCSARSPAGTTF